ncbi:MAG: glucose-1-phosphate thymidylyltransferase RfbA [Cellulosilyticaceae bacterium]
MKGIILAGGSGTRLYPVTCVLSKQILPIYNKPMIYYPLAILMMADIREILVISTPRDTQVFESLLGDGSQLGLTIKYEVQEKPQGIAEAFLIGESFIGEDTVCVVLGDNIFWGEELEKHLQKASQLKKGAYVFGYPVKNPDAFGVLVFDAKHQVVAIEEKPKVPKSTYAVPGLYFYDNQVVSMAKQVEPSARGELEITSINNAYIEKQAMDVILLEEQIRWLDTGTYKALLDASRGVEQLEGDGIFVGAIEAIAYQKGYIKKEALERLIEKLPESVYKHYLRQL